MRKKDEVWRAQDAADGASEPAREHAMWLIIASLMLLVVAGTVAAVSGADPVDHAD
ncbi:hypothetical protein [Variovorax sp. WS11]|uniref:hypothetical protein n=1 Tax=Variovorax sp. WS11 TaxID=1105204 RepID=UPI0013DCCBB8|nr:hypothetical protein [Variovorax sp. WS11]NDZ18408.1 hypothetical protein [Variovorax sp. WS11]